MKKTVKFNQQGISKLPNNKPITYDILTPSGGVNYTGSAKRGRGSERLSEHLSASKIPGAKVRITQHNSIAAAQKSEATKIQKLSPKYNKQGK